MKDCKMSDFMLERYRLGELSPEDNLSLRKALVSDSRLESSLNQLEKSDEELRFLYPYESLQIKEQYSKGAGKRKLYRRVAMVAAAITLCLLFPITFFLRNDRDNSLADRAKGAALNNLELSLFLKGVEDAPLPKECMLDEGNTVQLAYTAPSGEFYGVIFSVDGRFEATMHYPYQRGQSSLLVSGRRVYLNEAYILDDAPDFEIFVMVVSPEPLDAEELLWEAKSAVKMAVSQHLDAAGFVEEKIKKTYKGCEAEIVKILKKHGEI